MELFAVPGAPARHHDLQPAELSQPGLHSQLVDALRLDARVLLRLLPGGGKALARFRALGWQAIADAYPPPIRAGFGAAWPGRCCERAGGPSGMSALGLFVRWWLGLASPETQTTDAERDCIARYAGGCKAVAEIGVWHGVTTCRLLQAMDPAGTLWAVD